MKALRFIRRKVAFCIAAVVRRHAYAVIALNENGVKECTLFTNSKKAWGCYEKYKANYGNSNVWFYSRYIVE